MFEYLQKYIPGGSGVNDNFFTPVLMDSILSSERRLGFCFPEQLKVFFKEVGTGMLRSPDSPPEGYKFYNKNCILRPEVITNFYQGNLILEDDDCYMSEDAYELLQPGDIPFFEVADSSWFFKMKALSDSPNAVWDIDDYEPLKIADSLEEFIYKLYYEDPEYYGDIYSARVKAREKM